MPLQIAHQDITKIACDAIVNPSDFCFSGGGGTDYAIHKAAGKELDAACSRLSPIDCGEVAATEGFNLPCKYIIHTMGPIWEGGEMCEATLLRSCYLNALIKAKQLRVKSIAFPLISSGTFGFPKDKVLRIAVDAISDYLFTIDSDMDVTICILDRNSFVMGKEIALREYLEKNRRFIYEGHAIQLRKKEQEVDETIGCAPMPMEAPKAMAAEGIDLSRWIKKQDDTFAVLLLKLIDKKGMDDVECYKRANVSKNTFSKIKNSGTYKPSKPTVIAFAIALRLSFEETEALLKSAGFALAHNNTFDMIIEFFIKNEVYDIFEINAALYQYDQVCLGC